jgi:hypothetical protein
VLSTTLGAGGRAVSVGLWTVAMTAFVAAGMGALGARAFRPAWPQLAVCGAVASLWFLGFSWPTDWALIGGAIDVALVLAAWKPLSVGRGAASATPRADAVPAGRLRRTLGWSADVASVLGVAWLAANALALPWHTRWGSTAAELALALPGDQPLSGPPTYWLQRGISIEAPPEAVWPWLAQLGTDRGGFYSHSGLERLFGVPVENADRIHPEWQRVATSGFVMATPAGYLGFDEPLGWTVSLAEPGRALVLDKWGAFVIVPQPDGSTRLIVRTRNRAPVTPAAIALSWFGLVVFEPAHFIMERGMLEGIKARAEEAYREQHRSPT